MGPDPDFKKPGSGSVFSKAGSATLPLGVGFFSIKHCRWLKKLTLSGMMGMGLGLLL